MATPSQPPAAPICREAMPASSAAGSASEVRTALRVAAAWGYVEESDARKADAVYDRMLGMLWRLTGGRR